MPLQVSAALALASHGRRPWYGLLSLESTQHALFAEREVGSRFSSLGLNVEMEM